MKSKEKDLKLMFPTKYSYVMISEYFKKEKRIATRLEKVNM